MNTGTATVVPPQRCIAVVVGSLRQESFSRKIAKAVEQMIPSDLGFQIVEIVDLPLYNEDLEGGDLTPPAWDAFRSAVSRCDAVLFVTPEYNRSVPGVLKNALDVGSRPYGRSVWKGKPSAIISVSLGALGGFGANHHLRQSLVFLNMPTLLQPEAYIGHAAEMFAEDGALTHESTNRFLNDFMKQFITWIDTVAD